MRQRRGRWRLGSAVLAVAVLTSALTACQRSSGSDGDCNARVLFKGKIYGSPQFSEWRGQPLARTPRHVGAMDIGRFLDCDGSKMGPVRVSAVDGFPVAQAIYADDRSGLGLYFAQGLKRTPARLRAALVPVPCTRPTRFTATWISGLGTEQRRHDTVKYTLPYIATFETDSGPGLPLGEWAKVTVRGEISATTRPSPPTHDLVDAALVGREPAEVAVHCAGGRFIVDRITLA